MSSAHMPDLSLYCEQHVFEERISFIGAASTPQTYIDERGKGSNLAANYLPDVTCYRRTIRRGSNDGY